MVAALKTDESRVARVLCLTQPLGSFVGSVLKPDQLPAVCQQGLASEIERPTCNDEMGDAVSGPRGAGLSGCGRQEARYLHLVRPLDVVVPSDPVSSLPAVLLPEMDHLMHQRGENFGVRAPVKSRRIEGDLVDWTAVRSATCELRSRKIAASTRFALQGNERGRQLAPE